MTLQATPATDSMKIPVLTDTVEILLALCDADEWDLARKLARSEDARRRA
jgi:hypothetical protein